MTCKKTLLWSKHVPSMNIKYGNYIGRKYMGIFSFADNSFAVTVRNMGLMKF